MTTTAAAAAATTDERIMRASRSRVRVAKVDRLTAISARVYEAEARENDRSCRRRRWWR